MGMYTFVTDKDLINYTLSEILGASEIDRYDALLPAKQQSWLLGRLAAKQALIERVLEQLNVQIPLKHLTIISGEGVRPSFRIAGASISEADMRNIEQSFNISLSHHGTIAVASSAHTCHDGYVGVDVEPVRVIREETIYAFLTPHELKTYQMAAKEEQSRLATMYWCLKESYLKALGVGLRIHPRRVEMRSGTIPQVFGVMLDGRTMGSVVRWELLKNKYIVTRALVPSYAERREIAH